MLAVVAVLSCAPQLWSQEHQPPKVRQSPAYLADDEARSSTLYERVLPTVVTILTSEQVLTSEGQEIQEGLGSGVLISKECHVLTAAHVVAGADRILVKTFDDQLREAELLFSEAGADIALLRLVEADPNLPHAVLGDSDVLAVGQSTYVIGSPYGLEHSFSVGHISAFREFDRLYDGSIVVEFIQTDAAINSGNSGGPMFNSKGEVIGIASRILTVSGGFQGLGFVVAINTAKQLLALEDRTWLGIESIFFTREQLAALLNLDLETDGGLLVQRVTTGSPAEKAGIRGGAIPVIVLGQEILLGGDLILAFDTQDTCHEQCLVNARGRLAGLDRIRVRFLRGGKRLETEVDVSAARRNFLSSGDDDDVDED
jgi:S1-C subfamily serine protease